MADSIKLTCPNCDKTIKAPRAAAGKRGKCPHCHTSIYVPTPREEIEEIPLAPLEGNLGPQVRRQDFELEAALRRDREAPDGGEPAGPRPGPAPAGEQADAGATSASIQDLIVEYLVAMQSSSLREAASCVQQLKRSPHQAKSKIQQLMVDAMPPDRVREMPAGLYRGFLRKLLDQLE